MTDAARGPVLADGRRRDHGRRVGCSRCRQGRSWRRPRRGDGRRRRRRFRRLRPPLGPRALPPSRLPSLRRRIDAAGLSLLDLEVVRLRPASPSPPSARSSTAGELGAQFLLAVSHHESPARTADELCTLADWCSGTGVTVALEPMRFTTVPTFRAACHSCAQAASPTSPSWSTRCTCTAAARRRPTSPRRRPPRRLRAALRRAPRGARAAGRPRRPRRRGAARPAVPRRGRAPSGRSPGRPAGGPALLRGGAVRLRGRVSTPGDEPGTPWRRPGAPGDDRAPRSPPLVPNPMTKESACPQCWSPVEDPVSARRSAGPSPRPGWRAVAADIRPPEGGHLLDTTDEAGWDRVLDAVWPLDGLVNCAGIRDRAPLAEMELAGLPADDRRPRDRVLPGHPRRGPALGRRGPRRGRRQHLLGDRHPGRRRSDPLRHRQGRDRRPHPGRGDRAGRVRHPGQRDRPRASSARR